VVFQLQFPHTADNLLRAHGKEFPNGRLPADEKGLRVAFENRFELLFLLPLRVRGSQGFDAIEGKSKTGSKWAARTRVCRHCLAEQHHDHLISVTRVTKSMIDVIAGLSVQEDSGLEVDGSAAA
jgi:hypothetical protein